MWMSHPLLDNPDRLENRSDRESLTPLNQFLGQLLVMLLILLAMVLQSL